MSIKIKLLLILSFVGVLAAGISGLIGYRSAKVSLEEESFNKLTAVREMKADQVEDYIRIIRDQVMTFSEDRMIIDAVKSFTSAFQKMDGELDISQTGMGEIDARLRAYYEDEFLPRLYKNHGKEDHDIEYWSENTTTRILQDLYISSSPHLAGSKHQLDAAEDGSTYSKVHGLYHPIIRSYLEKFGFYDIFLVDPETGHIVYSVFKEVDFGTSLLTGPYRETNFSEAFRAARDAGAKDFVRLVDFDNYHPSYNDQASFISSPIFEDGKLVGVLLFQMPIDRINAIMTNKQKWSDVGLGASGETYIVGDDYLLRNQSRFLIEDRDNYFKMIEGLGFPAETIHEIKYLNSTIGLQEVRTAGTEAALRGEVDTKIFPDYRDVPVLSSYKPLKIPDMHWVIMSEIDKAEAFHKVTVLRNRILISFFVLIIGIIALAVFFAKSITTPLKKLTGCSKELSLHDFAQSDPFHFSKDVAEIARHPDEVGTLAVAFQKMESELNQSVVTLKETMRSNERMEGELNVAHDIQMSMLPLLYPAIPGRPEIAVYATLQPAREVGGDFFDYCFIDDDHFFFCIADVSDKGVPAALFMAVSKTLIKSRIMDDPSPSSVMTRVNEELSKDNPACMFVTVFAAVLNVRTGELRYTNAGHNPPYLKRADGTLEKMDGRHGPVVGAIGGIEYKEDLLHLSHSDTAILYTDGVTEAKNPANELFTEKRLVDLLHAPKNESAEQFVAAVISEVEIFQGTADQADDITVLALEFLGEPDGEEVLLMDLTIKNKLAEIDVVDQKIASLSGTYGFDKPMERKIRMACDELLNNVISYGYEEESEHEIGITMTMITDRVTIIITDDGHPFNPFNKLAPDTTSSLEDREIGGLGIHLVRNLMSKVAYRREEGAVAKNIITLVKCINSEECSMNDKPSGQEK